MKRIKAPGNYNVLRGTVHMRTNPPIIPMAAKHLISLALAATMISCTETLPKPETSFENSIWTPHPECQWSLTTFMPLKSHIATDITQQTPGRGVILLVPGLNNNTSSIKALAGALYSKGFHVEHLELPGQGPSTCTEDRMADVWRSSVAEATTMLASKYPNTPIYQIGYSLGGALVANYILADENPIPVVKAVLIAPAINLTTKTSSVRALLWLRHLHIPLPSLAPADMRANKSVSLAHYKATLEIADRLKPQTNLLLRNKTQALVIISSTDTLVSPTDTATWTARGGVEQWKFHEVIEEGGCWSPEGHFLPFPQHSSGFEELKETALNFLLEE